MSEITEEQENTSLKEEQLRQEEDKILNIVKNLNKVPLFDVGEILDIKGGKFRLKSFGKKFLMLEAMPGTTLYSGVKTKTDDKGNKTIIGYIEAGHGGRLK